MNRYCAGVRVTTPPGPKDEPLLCPRAGYPLPFLKADFRLPCYDTEWYFYATIGITMAIAYTLGLPVALYVILRRQFYLTFPHRKHARKGPPLWVLVLCSVPYFGKHPLQFRVLGF